MRPRVPRPGRLPVASRGAGVDLHAWRPAPPLSTPNAAPGPDHERLARLLEQEGLSTSDDGPNVLAWLQDVVTRGLQDLLEGSLPAVAGSAGAIALLVILLAGILAAVVTVRLVRILRAGRAPATGEEPAAQPLPAALAPPTRAEIERHLADGDPAAALRALWRWVAAHVEAHGFARPAPDRTNRELLAEVRRAAPGWDRLPALARLTNEVDGLLYGGAHLDVTSVRALLPLAEQVVR